MAGLSGAGEGTHSRRSGAQASTDVGANDSAGVPGGTRTADIVATFDVAHSCLAIARHGDRAAGEVYVHGPCQNVVRGGHDERQFGSRYASGHSRKLKRPIGGRDGRSDRDSCGNLDAGRIKQYSRHGRDAARRSDAAECNHGSSVREACPRAGQRRVGNRDRGRKDCVNLVAVRTRALSLRLRILVGIDRASLFVHGWLLFKVVLLPKEAVQLVRCGTTPFLD
jgi:hypothetical protein